MDYTKSNSLEELNEHSDEWMPRAIVDITRKIEPECAPIDVLRVIQQMPWSEECKIHMAWIASAADYVFSELVHKVVDEALEMGKEASTEDSNDETS